MDGRRAYLVWAVAVGAYAVAVLHRTSLGVAGIEAAERFSVGASVLSSFVIVQLATYALLQLPVGVLLDRFGTRRMLSLGAVAMAAGQLAMASVGSVGWAMVARVLIGAGDAMTFVSVMRLLPDWFSPRRVPVLTQLTGVLGQLGQLLSAIPLVTALHLVGWRSSFLGLAAVGALTAACAALVIRDAPTSPQRPLAWWTGAARGRRRRARIRLGTGIRVDLSGLRAAIRQPGTWLGFWSHFVTQFSTTVFMLLWGFPFLVSAQGLAPAQASLLLASSVLATIVAGPVLGELTARHPLRRSWLVLGVAGMVAAGWALVLVPSRPSPLWVLVCFVVLIGVGGPGSLIGFDFARSFNRPAHLGTATGIVNGGGFFAALLSMAMIGLVLDLVSPTGATTYTLGAYRAAFATMAVPFVVGVLAVLAARRRTRSRMAAVASQPATGGS